LCQCFVRGTTDPDVLPFSIDLVNDAVKARGGLISRLAKARWRVGEKYVLIWIQSGVIRRDRFVILDHGGEAVDLCKPVRPRHLET